MLKDNTIMKMETDRIILRRWQEEDADALYRYASDTEVGPRAGWPPHQSIESSRSIIRNLFTNDRTWAVVWKATLEPIGSIGYLLAPDSHIPLGDKEAEVGYWIGRPYWNKGICTEALRLLVDYCSHTMGFKTLWGTHFTDNRASGRVMEKCDFSDTGRTQHCSDLYGGNIKPVRVLKLSINS